MHSRDPRENPGIKRAYLELPSTLEGEQSFCITIPGGLDNKKRLIDLLTITTRWYSWQRSSGIEAKQTADAWRDTLNLPELKMCCCPEPTNRRYDEDGNLEVSYDGGITWIDDPSLDDRFSGIVAPPIAGEDGTEKACAAAASAEDYVKLNLIEDLTVGSTFADINAAIIAIVAALGITGVGVLIAAAAAAIFIAGVSAVQAAFTTEVWVDFRCILYCHIEDDGSYTVSGWNAVKVDILASFTGVVQTILWNWVNSVGVVGLTNAARSGFVAVADCDDCGCDNGCAAKYQIFDNDVFYGTIIEYGDDYIICETGGTGFMTLEAINPSDCCYVNAIEFLSGTGSGSAFRVCGDTTPPPWTAATPIGQCANIIEVQFTTGYPGGQVKIFLDNCP